ncbi:MAG: hypothetical protein ACK5HL_04125 [Bacilli bacterium]
MKNDRNMTAYSYMNVAPPMYPYVNNTGTNMMYPNGQMIPQNQPIVPLNQYPNSPMPYDDSIKELEKQIRRLEVRVSRLESMCLNDNNYINKQPFNSTLHMI